MDEPLDGVSRFFRELKRRNVYRVAAMYAVVAFVVWQAADLLFPALRFPAWTVDFVIVLTLLGFPIALVLAWAFEMTPEGVRRTPAAGPEPGAPSGAGEAGEEGRLETVRFGTGLAVKGLIGLGLLAAAVAGGWYLTGGGGATEPRAGDRSIAVLPFETLSSGEDSETFARGIHDDLLTRLAHISGLKVISRTAVQQYRGTELTTGEVADSLGVRWVMEGGVQVLGDQIQVNAQLIDPRTETHAWAETYRRDLTAEDLFGLQSEITKQIARSLEAELTSEETERVEEQPTRDLAAYRLYVKGRRLLDRRNGEAIREAVDYFEQALQQDSSYALAWSGLADARGLYPYYGPDTLGPAFSAQERAARRAVQLDPDLAEARSSLGFTFHRQLQGPAALRELKRATELKPSYAQAHHWLGVTLRALGRPEASREHLALAVELNPSHWNARWHLILTQVASGAYEEALAEVRRARAQFSGHLWTEDEVAVLAHLGRREEMRRVVRRHRSRSDDGSPDDMLYHLALADVAEGDTAAAARRLERLRAGRDQPSLLVGVVQAALGHEDGALEMFRRRLRTLRRDGVTWPEHRGIDRLTDILRYFYPRTLGGLRDDPRYEELLREVNRLWGLNPDGSLPDSVDVSFEARSDG